MTLQTGNWISNRRRSPGYSGFTLVELIIVMFILATVMAISAPRMSRFFKGRILQEEAQRLVALTRYAQSESVSRSIPMTVWIDIEQQRYGLAPKEGYQVQNLRLLEYELSDRLRLELDASYAPSLTLTSIEYLPDGSLSETSPPSLTLREETDHWLRIAQTRNRMNYEIVSELEYELRDSREVDSTP